LSSGASEVLREHARPKHRCCTTPSLATAVAALLTTVDQIAEVPTVQLEEMIKEVPHNQTQVVHKRVEKPKAKCVEEMD